MKEIKGTLDGDGIRIALSGRIDSNNAHAAEEEIARLTSERPDAPVVMDLQELEYISSAGLRVLLHLKKTHPDLRLVNVTSEVYEILDMTGFTEMMTVEKAYRVVSVEGCEEIGRGANGTIYRIDSDNVVKVYNNPEALADIQHEREVARIALVLGIPTAISYDVVKVGESYGSVFELLNARSFSRILAEEPARFDWCVKEFTDMLKKIHATLVPAGKLPDMRETALDWTKFLRDYLPPDAAEKLDALVLAVPHDDHMLHGDYHTKNLELVDDEVLLIDMDTLAVGHPIFELASMYNAFVGYGEFEHERITQFLGFPFETAQRFWRAVLAAYLGTQREETIRAVEDRARIIGYARMIRRSIRRKGLETEQGRAEIALWTDELTALLKTTDSLLFLPCALELDAEVEKLPVLLEFLDRHLTEVDCPAKAQMQLAVAAEEVFVNIASYAYAPGHGKATVCLELSEGPRMAMLTFTDAGMPFDPLGREDPEVTLSAEERDVGGLGILMTKKLMDEVSYEYRDGKNVLTLKKLLGA